MKFQELHDTIPFARFGKEKSLQMRPYGGIILALPGRHAEDTTPKGGDFVVMVTDPGIKWKSHQFTHDDIFNDVELKAGGQAYGSKWLMDNYLGIVTGTLNPMDIKVPGAYVGISPRVLFCALQCLAVAEHRRYAQYEDKFGGRYLPFRFAAGIAEGLWTADDCIKVQKYGRPAVERLEKSNGVPALTQKLMTP